MFHLPLIDHKITFAFSSFLNELLGGVDVGKDGNKGDDEAEDPDSNDERNHNPPGEIFSVGLGECYDLAPPACVRLMSVTLIYISDI